MLAHWGRPVPTRWRSEEHTVSSEVLWSSMKSSDFVKDPLVLQHEEASLWRMFETAWLKASRAPSPPLKSKVTGADAALGSPSSLSHTSSACFDPSWVNAQVSVVEFTHVVQKISWIPLFMQNRNYPLSIPVFFPSFLDATSSSVFSGLIETCSVGGSYSVCPFVTGLLHLYTVLNIHPHCRLSGLLLKVE